MKKTHKKTIHELSEMIYNRDKEIEDLKEDLDELMCSIYNVTPNRTEDDIKNNVFDQMEVLIDKMYDVEEQIKELQYNLADSCMYWSEYNIANATGERLCEPSNEILDKWKSLVDEEVLKKVEKEWK